jgi:hypothetical protein
MQISSRDGIGIWLLERRWGRGGGSMNRKVRSKLKTPLNVPNSGGVSGVIKKFRPMGV